MKVIKPFENIEISDKVDEINATVDSGLGPINISFSRLIEESGYLDKLDIASPYNSLINGLDYETLKRISEKKGEDILIKNGVFIIRCSIDVPIRSTKDEKYSKEKDKLHYENRDHYLLTLKFPDINEKAFAVDYRYSGFEFSQFYTQSYLEEYDKNPKTFLMWPSYLSVPFDESILRNMEADIKKVPLKVWRSYPYASLYEHGVDSRRKAKETKAYLDRVLPYASGETLHMIIK